MRDDLPVGCLPGTEGFLVVKRTKESWSFRSTLAWIFVGFLVFTATGQTRIRRLTQDARQLAICPSLTFPARKKQIPNRKTNQRIMELPLHARLDFCEFGSIWERANRSLPTPLLAYFVSGHLCCYRPRSLSCLGSTGVGAPVIMSLAL